MKNARISGVGHYLPDRVVTNNELAELLDVTDESIVKLTGIQQRRWATKDDTLKKMALAASVKAIDQAGLNPGDIGLILFAGLSSDYQFPGTAILLQYELDIPGVPGIDIRNVCSGFIYGLSIADQYIKTGAYEHILLVGAELHSTSMDLTPEGSNVSILFGDGAGAVVISATKNETQGILNTQIYSDGKYAEKLWLEAPTPNDHPRLNKELMDTNRIYPYMDGRTVFKHAVARFPEVIQEAVDKAGLQTDDLDLVIPHQANLRITEMVTRRLGLDQHKVFSNIQHCGNTTAASIPIALSEALEQDRIKNHDLVCFAAFGAGFAWGSALMRW